MHARIALVAVASAAAVFAFGGVASVVAAPDVQTGKVAVRPFEYGDRVAFYGDSITRNGEAITRMAAYYRRAFPGRHGFGGAHLFRQVSCSASSDACGPRVRRE